MTNLELYGMALENAREVSSSNPGKKVCILWDEANTEFTIIFADKVKQHEKKFGKLPLMATFLNGVCI